MSKRPLDEDRVIPITAVEFHILLALAGRQFSGYGIMQECEVDSEGLVRIGPGTIYPALTRLARAGWIVEAERLPGRGSPHDRRLYRPTTTGYLVLQWETDRLRRAAHLAEARLAAARRASTPAAPAADLLS